MKDGIIDFHPASKKDGSNADGFLKLTEINDSGVAEEEIHIHVQGRKRDPLIKIEYVRTSKTSKSKTNIKLIGEKAFAIVKLFDSMPK